MLRIQVPHVVFFNKQKFFDKDAYFLHICSISSVSIFSQMLKQLAFSKLECFPNLLLKLSPFWDLQYADDTANDTILIFNSTQQCARLVRFVHKKAHIHGPSLNFDQYSRLM